MDQQDRDRTLLDVRLKPDETKTQVSSEDMQKAIEETKREIQAAFGERTPIEASTK